MPVNAKTIRRIIGILVLLAILLRGVAITNYIEAHPVVGIILLVCAVAYILWGMFWKKDEEKA